MEGTCSETIGRNIDAATRYTPKAIAAHLGISEQFVLSLMAQGKLPRSWYNGKPVVYGVDAVRYARYHRDVLARYSRYC